MNSMDIIPFVIAKRELKDNEINTTPASLLFGLIPGVKVPLIQQVILNKAVVEGEVAQKEREILVRKISDMETSISNLDSEDPKQITIINILRLAVGLEELSKKNEEATISQ